MEVEGLRRVRGNHVKLVLDLVNPQHKGPWGTLSPILENNALAVNNQGGSVFSAAGDYCVYCWDVVCICSRIIENDLFKQDWRSRTKIEIFQYVDLKWTLVLLIGLGTGLVGFLSNLGVENIACTN